MQLDNLTVSSLRDAVKDNTNYVRKLREELHIANLLKLLEYGFIEKDNILTDPIYQDYKEKYGVKPKQNKKSL